MERIEQVKMALEAAQDMAKQVGHVPTLAKIDAALASLEGERGTGAPEDVVGVEPVAWLDAEGNGYAPKTSPIAKLLSEIPDPPVGKKLLPLYSASALARVAAEAATLRARVAELEAKVERAGEVIAPFSRLAENYSMCCPSDAVFAKGCVYVYELRAARRYVEEGK